MKKYFMLFVTCILCLSALAQIPTLQQKLYYTCKVWGFVKYYHSNVSVCNVNWDSVLLASLPAIKNAANDSEFNDALDSMLEAAGPMALSSTYFPDTLAPALKRNRNFNWISNAIFRADVQIILDTIKNNFRPHPICSIHTNNYTTSNNSYLILPDDDTELNVNTYTNYPDEYHRLLMLFKYWNVISFLNPNNYVLDTPWDTTLYNYVLNIDAVGNTESLFSLYEKINATLDDAHVEGFTYDSYYYILPGYYQPYVRLIYIYPDSQYVVTKSNIPGIYPGDALISIDGLTTAQWEDSLRPYISAGNTSVFKRTMSESMLGRQSIGINETLIIEDSTGTNHTFNTPTLDPGGDYNFYYSTYYPADSLESISYTTLPCDIGYANLENLQPADVNTMYSDLQNKSAIIFDIRNDAVNTIGQIADLIFPSTLPFANLMFPDTTYPGTFYYGYESIGSSNSSAYTGTVIILINEQTQSHDEYYSMIFGALPNTVKVGSHTAGADGNISYWNLSRDIYTGYTSLGVFYPNGDSTQRIGIVPDSVVYPTKAGIRHKDDEVLNKALAIAGCTNLKVKNITLSSALIKAFPNPTDDIVNIEASNINSNIANISVTDITGKVLLQKDVEVSNNGFLTSVDMKSFARGLYILTVKTDMQQYITKIVKE